MNFNELPEFEKEFKKLSKKYKSLPDDFEDLKKVLAISPRLEILWENWIKRVPLWEKLEGVEIYKIRRFRCFSISKNSKDSGLRIIYHYHEWEDKIEFEKVDFIEIYHKNKKTNHNQERIEENYKSS